MLLPTSISINEGHPRGGQGRTPTCSRQGAQDGGPASPAPASGLDISRPLMTRGDRRADPRGTARFPTQVQTKAKARGITTESFGEKARATRG